MAVAQAKADALAARVDGLSAGGTGWLGVARRDASARLAQMGLPSKRDEYWRYTDPASLVAALPTQAALFDLRDEAPAFDGVDALSLVFVDGVFDPAQSDDPAMAGVEITHLSAAEGVDIHWAREVYGVLEARGQTPVQRPLATLNTAYATQGLLIRVTAKAVRPVSLVYLRGTETSDAMIHHCVKVEKGAE